MSPRLLLIPIAALALAAVACSDDESTDVEVTGPDGKPARWEQVVPGGDCECSDGSEFSFYLRRADPSKVVFFLQGGGACWNAEWCGEKSNFYKHAVEPGDDPTGHDGIFAFDNDENPLAGYSFVFVPYCTADMHQGNAIREYAPDLTIHHNGFVNTSTAFLRLVEAFPDAEQVVVAGESAGAVAAPLYAGMIADALPAAKVAVLADGAGGFGHWPERMAVLDEAWAASATLPPWADGDEAGDDWTFPSLFVGATTQDPDIMFARHDYAHDAVVRVFTDEFGERRDGEALLAASERWIEAQGVELATYVARGDGHTVLSQPEFYTEDVKGVPLVSWVAELVNGQPVDDVRCDRCE